MNVMPVTSTKVLVALSGGVDSSVCVRLLQEAGYVVYGVVLKMTPIHEATVKAAQDVADSLGIKLFVKEMYNEFKQNVIDYFTNAYRCGETPNPCVVCNPKVKFKALIDTADENNIHYIATGHYAQIALKDGIYKIKAGKSTARDQSYMLYRLGQDVLSRLIFPLADFEKDEVREKASKLSLSSANAPDSQENCFIPDNDYAGYIESHCGKSPVGDFISPEGKPCGKHQGIIHYTVGQRKRLGIALGRPVFIKRIDSKTNNIYLADSGNEFSEEIMLSDVFFSSGKSINSEFNCRVKIRSVSRLTPATAIPTDENQIKIIFESPQRAPAKGQSVVLYDEDECVIGGGFISSDIQ